MTRRGLGAADPRFAVIGLVCAGSLAVLMERPVALSALLLVGVVAFFTAPIAAKTRMLMVLVVAGVVWSNVLGQGFFHVGASRTVWWTLLAPRGDGLLAQGLVLSKEGVLHGLVQSLRFAGLLLLGAAVTASLSAHQLLQGLSILRLPPVLLFAVATALRAVPELANEWALLRQAARLRGLGPDRRHPLRSLVREPLLLRPLLARIVIRSQQLALAGRARGLNLNQHISSSDLPPMQPLQRMVLMLLVALTVVVAAGKVVLFMYAADVPGLPRWYGLLGWIRRWMP